MVNSEASTNAVLCTPAIPTEPEKVSWPDVWTNEMRSEKKKPREHRSATDKQTRVAVASSNENDDVKMKTLCENFAIFFNGIIKESMVSYVSKLLHKI